MKQIFKLNRFMLALIIMTGITTSCVENEQDPNSIGIEDGNGNLIDAKLPNPGDISFYVGDEVIIKGSGFTDSDEIYIHNLEYDENNDTNGDGIYNPINVKAKIKSCTSNKITFIVPEEVSPEEYSSFFVYLRRNSKEYRIGNINIYSFYVSYESRNITIHKERISGNEKVYYQNIKRNNKNSSEYEFIGEKQEFKHKEFNSYSINISNQYALGEFMVFIENNGEIAPCGFVNADIDEMIKSNVYNLQPGTTFDIYGTGFLENDILILKGNNENIELEIVDKSSNENLEFPETLTVQVPYYITHYYYDLILIRNGVEHVITKDINI